VRILAGLFLLPLLVAAQESKPKVTAAQREAVRKYLDAGSILLDGATHDQAVKAFKGDFAAAVECIRSMAPLSKLGPGSHHGLKFWSGGHTWEYSIRLPKGYDGKKRFPVLVLPDHGLISPEDGISFWERGKEIEDYILFRPVIVKHAEDKTRFPDQQFFARDMAVAERMRAALRTLRIHYAVDPDRLVMTGLSQAGYYTWYFAVSFPDDFAAIIPESSGGLAVRTLLPSGRNLAEVAVRILHAEGDEVTPLADAEAMKKSIEEGGGKVEFIKYTDKDYPPGVAGRHPGPHDLRLKNVLPWGLRQKRSVPAAFTRVLRYKQQGHEGRWRLQPPEKPTTPVTVTCSEAKGVLTATGGDAIYLVSPDDVLAKRAFAIKGERVVPRGDVALLLKSFKATGDFARATGAELPVQASR
jgi:dienelactone hydrolase